MQFELYQVKNGTQATQWRWRLRAGNGKIIASGESYFNRSDAVGAVHSIMDTNRETPFIEIKP